MLMKIDEDNNDNMLYYGLQRLMNIMDMYFDES
jgi:hypothetical protein